MCKKEFFEKMKKDAELVNAALEKIHSTSNIESVEKLLAETEKNG